MDGNTDISKIIGIIMENPEIIEKIKTLANQNETQGEKEDYSDNDSQKIPTDIPYSNETEIKTNTQGIKNDSDTYRKISDKKRRRELLCALKPYVTPERSKAIDTMLSLIDVIDIMKER